jgi:hypothetical protein
MKSLVWGATLLAAATGAMTTICAAADFRAERRYSPAVEQFTYSWVAMPLLPRRLQNHCGYYNGNFVCADHCGTDYQVYYCGGLSTGCCHIGRGYCDGTGTLRCSPSLF